MSVKIRMKRFGAKARPYYRIVVMDSRNARDGKTIDELGYYHPIEADEKQFKVDGEKVKSWVAKGAIVSTTLKKLFNKNKVAVK